ncbi:amino acid adenylation domain-containing protein, partial [Micromonospora fluostatini]
MSADPHAAEAAAADDLNLMERFAQAVARYPDRTAVSDGDTLLTYAALDRAVTRLAAEILGRVPQPGARVGLLLPRSVDLVVAALAVLRAGASYVPLDRAAPGSRLELILDDARPALVLSTTDDARQLPDATPTLLLDGPRQAPTQPATFPPVPASSVAYTIFTSGTTGRPKGVQVSHTNVTRLFTSSHDLFRFGCEDVWSLFHSFAFDYSVWEMWGALLHGGHLVVVPEETARDPAAFRRLLREQAVTVLSQTPTAFRTLVHEEPNWPDRLPLRLVVFGGEALTFADLAPWVAKYGDHAPELVNMYGITEITVHGTYQRVRAHDVSDQRSMIGVPLPDLGVLLVDGELRQVAPGETGEIVVTGPGVALGYLNRPELTRQRFLDLRDEHGQPVRGYRSGDLARRHPDGGLEYLGRADQQVKIRGFRVELSEIEHALRRHPAIRHAVASTRPGGGGEVEIVAHVVPAGTAVPGEPELRGHLNAWLPDYMVPTAIGVLDAVPMTVNGKIDRTRLPDLTATVAGDTAPSRPRHPADELLCLIFAQVLARPAVTMDDDFFALGGNSLTAIRLVNRVRAVLGWNVGVKNLFEARTPAALIRRTTADTDSRSPLTAQDRSPEAPLSYAQRRLWFLHQIHGANPAYHIPHALHLTGRVDSAALAAAVRDVMVRHEILRTRYPERNSEPVQQILAPERIGTCLVTRTVPAGLLDEAVTESTRRPFDLTTDLPLRAELLVTGAESSVLVLTLHHIAADGWSLEPLIRDLATAYAARRTGLEPRFDPLPVQYADYAIWQRDLLGETTDPDSRISRHLRYWSHLLDGVPEELDLPADRPRPATASFDGEMLPLRIDADLHRHLLELARESGATVNMVLQAATAALLTRLGAGTDIPIGNVVAGRDDQALHDVVGFFVNTVVTRTDTSGNPSFVELLRRVRTGNLAALDHAEMPFDRLVEMLNPVRSPARHPLAQVMLGAQNSIPSGPLLAGLTVEPQPVGTGTAKFDLSVKFEERYDTDHAPLGIRGALEYSADLFDRGTVERIIQRLLRLLTVVAERPDTPLWRIDLLAAGELEHLVPALTSTAVRPPAQATVAALVEEQVDRTPDAVAVIQGSSRWTYRD